MDKGFDPLKFESTEFHPRMEEVELPEMAFCFPKGEKALFKIRNLSADEVARTNDAIKTSKMAESLITALTSMNQADMVKSFKAQLGYGEEVNGEVQRRIELILYGCVEPKLPRELVVKMGTVFPTAFYKLSNKITDLTGLGMEMGKPGPSGETQESKPV